MVPKTGRVAQEQVIAKEQTTQDFEISSVCMGDECVACSIELVTDSKEDYESLK